MFLRSRVWSRECMQMASMYCWPSVSIKHGASLVIARKIVKAEFEWTFGYLLIVIDSSFSNEQVARVITSKNAQFIDPYLVCNYFNFYFAYLPTLCLPIFCPRNITSS